MRGFPKHLFKKTGASNPSSFVTFGELHRFIDNLYVLFDGNPPEEIESYIQDMRQIMRENRHLRRAA